MRALLLAALLGAGCSPSRLSVAITAANTAGEIGDRAAAVLHDQCTGPYLEIAEAGGPVEERKVKVEALDRYCQPLRKAFGVYRAAHAATVAAVQVAELRGDPSDAQLATLLQQLARAGDQLSHAIAEVPR